MLSTRASLASPAIVLQQYWFCVEKTVTVAEGGVTGAAVSAMGGETAEEDDDVAPPRLFSFSFRCLNTGGPRREAIAGRFLSHHFGNLDQSAVGKTAQSIRGDIHHRVCACHHVGDELACCGA